MWVWFNILKLEGKVKLVVVRLIDLGWYGRREWFKEMVKQGEHMDFALFLRVKNHNMMGTQIVMLNS